MRKLIWICSIAALALTSCSNTSSRNVESSSKAKVAEKTAVATPVKPKQYVIEVVREYPHDEMSYTQGLFFQGGRMVETTGQFGESTLRLVDPATGEALKKQAFDSKYFVEGSVELDGNIYILTWKNKVAFIYDAATLEYKQTYSYPRDGWGLTSDGKNLIASDGSSRLFWMDSRFQLLKTKEVRLNGKPLRNINELEWIDGKIWANVYLTDMIVIIDPETGNVEGVVDCTGLLPDSLKDEYTDVLNGIAVDPSNGRIYVTGKYWKRLFEIRIKEKE